MAEFFAGLKVSGRIRSFMQWKLMMMHWNLFRQRSMPLASRERQSC
jgi:hypothetical protein